MPRGTPVTEYRFFSGSNRRAPGNEDAQRSQAPPRILVGASEEARPIQPGTEPVGVAGRAAALNPRGRVADDSLRRPHPPLYAVPFDGWCRELDALLVDFCGRGRDGQRQAMLAIPAMHPQISPQTTWARIVYLGLTTAKRPPYYRHEWSPEDVEVLRLGYSAGRKGASRTIEALLQRHPNWSRAAITWKAKSLGLSQKRDGAYRQWGEEADRKLISCEGFEMESVEKRMKRTIASIRSRLAVFERGAEFFGGFKTKELMELLHLDEARMRRLERRRLLRRQRGRITEDSLKSLCREHPEEIPFDTLDEATKQKLIADYEYAKPKRARQGGRKTKQRLDPSSGDDTAEGW